MKRAYWILAGVLTAASWGLAAWYYPDLPGRVPTHWNYQGQVDGFGRKETIFLLPLMTTGLMGLFALLPVLSPKNFEIDTMRSTYPFIMATTVGLFAFLELAILMETWREVAGAKGGIEIGRLLIGGLLVYFGLLGNVLGKVRKNFYVGVRVPWTLASDRVWNDTHRVAAWTMVVTSVLGLIVVVSGLPLYLAIVGMVGSWSIPLVYSFVHYKSLERRGAL